MTFNFAFRMWVKTFHRCYRKPTVLVPLCLITALGLVFNSKMISLVIPPNLQNLRKPEIETMKCVPKTNVVFMKTHKCASSTIQNIFMRYGDLHNLTFVLPASRNYLGHPAPFKKTMVPDPSRYHVTYNILTHHSRFNYKEMKLLMPNDTVFVTIVRNPVDLYESLYSYYNLNNVYKKTLLEAIDKLSHNVLNRRVYGRVGANQMLFDLGFESHRNINSTHVKSYVKSLDAIFDLVMVAERMDESLVLLRHLLCWDLDDVVAFKVNARSKKSSNITNEVRDKLKKLNWKDQLLYNYFLQRFEERVAKFGASSLAEEVTLLNEKRSSWYNHCVKRSKRANIITYEQKRDSNSTCAALTRSELNYTDYLRKRQKYMFPILKQGPHRKGLKIRRRTPFKRGIG
ncbi:galactosylceramide sulfotransferase-like [Centruroides vittatus]|uniref:galactosylceramide sulfotransferase-like n=1 Tax=Centruroides vittatus TaxID=120091 RepID=UPI00350EC41E